jgi:DNA (cytosine-5)-methyltransferase 1
MKVGSLFSGIGGFDLGFINAGYEVSWCVEKDTFCQKVLTKHFPNTKICDDITQVDPTTLDKIDVLVGGFPCQDISIAGKREGLQGARSSLFYEFDRYIRATNPRFVVVENVPGLLSSNSGHDFAFVLNEMVERWGAKSIAWRILDSQFFGVPQRRRRIFFVADLGGDCASEILSLSDCSAGNTSPSRKAGKTVTCTPAGIAGTCSSKWAKGTGGPAGDEHYNLIVYRWQNSKEGLVNDGTVATLRTSMGTSGFSEVNHPIVHAYSIREDASANTFSATPVTVSNALTSLQPSVQSHHAQTFIAEPSVVRRLTPLECERLQGFPDNWTEGQSDSQRYKQLGNAVTVNVAEWIAKRIRSVNRTVS